MSEIVKGVFIELSFGQYFFFLHTFWGECFVPYLTPVCCFLFYRID